MSLAKASFSLIAPGGRRGCLSILIFHRVLAAPDPMLPEEPDAREFSERMAFVAGAFNVLPLAEAVERLVKRDLPAAAAAITFDDGYADNYRVALPILRHYRLPATIFVASGFLNGGRMWNDTVIEAVRRAPGDVLDLGQLGLGMHPLRSSDERRRAVALVLERLKYRPAPERQSEVDRVAAMAAPSLPDDLMLSSAELRALASGGVEIGAHTVTHPILSRLDPEGARKEIVGGGKALEAILGKKIDLFAYPNGVPGRDFGPEHVQMVRDAGYAAAVTTGPGVSRAGTDVYQLPRFTPWDRSNMKFGARLAQNTLGLL
ncbi:MAG: polysaccharide deacetylase family protein [Casimicrobiaceae bacterium]